MLYCDVPTCHSSKFKELPDSTTNSEYYQTPSPHEKEGKQKRCLMASRLTSIWACDILPSQLRLKQRPFKSVEKTFLQEKAAKLRHGDDNEDIVLTVLSVGSSETTAQVIDLLELFLFIFKLWRQRIASIRDENNEKYNGLKYFEGATRDAEDATNKYKHSIRQEYYKNREQKCLEQKKCLEEALSTVWEEKEKANFRMTDKDLDRFQSQTARLCSLLGLKLDFLDYLEEMPREQRGHREESEWVKIFMEEKIEKLDSTVKHSLTVDLLERIGFDPFSSAVEIIMARSQAGSGENHVEASELAQLFIEDEFKYNPLLSTRTSKFPFPSSITNKWVPLPHTIPKEETQSNINLSSVKIMNLVTKESHAYSKARAAISAMMPKDDKTIALYHGTDHQSARQILVRGIYLNAGRQKRDFTCGKGFYLTTGMEDALNWAKQTTEKPAILIFAVDRTYLSKTPKLNLFEDAKKWREIVSCFRTATRTAITRETIQQYDMIEGPVARMTRHGNLAELVFEPKPSSYQMCLTSDRFAEEFEKTLHSVVFFDISQAGPILPLEHMGKKKKNGPVSN